MAKVWLHGHEIDPDDPNLSLEQRAQLVAQEANECCNRSDGYEEEIAALVLKHLKAAANSASAPANPPATGWEMDCRDGG